MLRLAIVGAGQLGSRHLQGVVQCKNHLEIYLVDPDITSLERAKQRVLELDFDPTKIHYHNSLETLPSSLDIVIVATSSKIRAQVVKTLLTKKIGYLFLEKVLFQDIESYYEIKDLLQTHAVPCWVNHPRRMFPFYQTLKTEFSQSKKITMSVSGGNWGLGCNALHFLDLLAYFSNNTNLIIDNVKLVDVFESKRPEYKEFYASLSAHIDNHSINVIASNTELATSITITDEKKRIIINEVEGQYSYFDTQSNNDIKKEQTKIIFFQSELTKLLIENLIELGSCALPTYDEAMSLHVPFIKAVLHELNDFERTEKTHCPIT